MIGKKKETVFKNTTKDSIEIDIDGISHTIERKLDALVKLMQDFSRNSIQTADKIYNIGTITNANFEYVIDSINSKKEFPEKLEKQLIRDNQSWIKSLKHELLDSYKLPVKNSSKDIFQYYGWLIEAFLQKLLSKSAKDKNLRRLSFMTEAWQASLRYLCYIQMAQLMESKKNHNYKLISDFIQASHNEHILFDYTSLLLITSKAVGENNFIPEIIPFTMELTNSDSLLFETSLYLNDIRSKLIKQKLNDSNMDSIIDRYLSALVYWLRKISFIAKYRLVSIKEINLDYNLGTNKFYVHSYGELHGIYNKSELLDEEDDDYMYISIEDACTFNKSILLFSEHVLESAFNDKKIQQKNYLCLSPLIIDQSVYSDKQTQTPEIFYFSGYDIQSKQYQYSLYKNELVYKGNKDLRSNDYLNIEEHNDEYLLNKLYKQIVDNLEPFKE
ncbi:hypothetical protein [Winogradskyella sp.]|uniref:hypothetical protein n=1 Tax=Winogradskyella sp. TaxID=1883156 RepID=UPI003BA906F2